jgi:hypothetical protein
MPFDDEFAIAIEEFRIISPRTRGLCPHASDERPDGEAAATGRAAHLYRK